MSEKNTSESVVATHRQMVTKLSKPGNVILSELSVEEAHLLHMWAGPASEYGELVEAYRALCQAYDQYEITQRSPMRSPAALAACLAKAEDAQAALLKECGDYSFYLAGFRVGLEFPDLDGLEAERTGDYSHRQAGKTAVDLLLELAVVQATLVDATKRIAIYRKGYPKKGIKASQAELDQERGQQRQRAATAIDQVELVLERLFTALGYSRSQVLLANIKKLEDPDNGRYAAGSYSDSAANARADVVGADDVETTQRVIEAVNKTLVTPAAEGSTPAAEVDNAQVPNPAAKPAKTLGFKSAKEAKPAKNP